jgi:uncharacterized protein (TIGR00251 family)
VLEISEDASKGTLSFSARVQPRASKNEIAGTIEGALKVRLTAPALENRANEALLAFLSELLRIPKAAVRIRSGEHSRTKRVEIRGLTRQQLLVLLQEEA